MRALLDDGELPGVVEAAPHFLELSCEERAEKWADAHIRKEVATAADHGAAGAVVAVFRMVKRLGHEVAECNRAAGGNNGAEQRRERRGDGGHAAF
jgi:hypothetical protein